MTAPAISRFETSPGALGTKRTNLVTERDNAWPKVQFRAQVEVWLPRDVAAAVDKAVMQGSNQTEEGLRAAEKLVMDHIDPAATAEFHQIISLAFKDQLNPAPK